MLREEPSALLGPEDLARVLDVDDHELMASALTLFHLTPEAWLLRQRLALARHGLLRQQRLTQGWIKGLGFGERESFFRIFQDAERLSPKAFQRLAGAKQFTLKLPKWLRFERLKTYWGRDPKSVSERVEGNLLQWAIRSASGPLRLRIDLNRPRASCEISGPGSVDPNASFFAHQTILRLLGLHVDPRPFERRMKNGPWSTLIAGREGWTPPQTADLFDALVWVIAGQQVSLAAAFSIRRRLNIAFGEELEDGWFVPPAPHRLAEVSVSSLAENGLTKRKAEALSLLARQILADEDVWRLETWRSMPAHQIEARLLAQKGLGPWSVGYVMMRALGFADCVPFGDVVLQRKLQAYFRLEERPDRDKTEELMSRFRPYRSLATFHFWALPNANEDRR